MADDKLSSKISIDVTDAKANIGALNREIKLLDSEFKASTAGLGDWGKSASGVEAKQKQLTGTIEAQKQKIENLNALYKDAVEKHGEHSKAAEDLKIKINNETAAMNSAEAELNSMGREMDEENEKQNKFAEGLKEGLVAAAEAAAAACAAVAAAVAECVKTAYEWSTNVGQTADDFNTLSVQTGISAETLQKWNYASQFVDTSLDTMTGSLTKVKKYMGQAADGSDSAAEKFDALGVSIYNSDGTLRDSEDVFWDCIEALGKMSNETERDGTAMELFGKSAEQLNPLIEAGRGEFEKLGDEAESLGIVLSEDELILANGFNDAQNKFNSTLTALKNDVGLIAIPAFNELLETAQTTVGGISSVLSDGIQDGDIEAIGELLKTGVTDAVGQLTGIVEELTPVVLEMLDALIDVVVAALPELLPPVISAAVTALTSIAEHLPEILTAVMDALASVDWAQVGATVVTGVFNAIGALLNDIPQIISSFAGLIAGLATALWNAIESIMPDWLLELLNGDDPEIKMTGSFEGSATEGALNIMADNGIEIDEDQIFDMKEAVANAYKDAVLEAYGITIDELTEGTQKSINTLTEMAANGQLETDTFIDTLVDRIERDNSDAGWDALGRDSAEGIAQGIKDSEQAIVSAVSQVMGVALDEAQKMLDIHSPSRVTRKLIGANFGAGIAQGIADSVAGIQSAASAAGSAAVSAMNSTVNGGSFTVNNNVNATIRSEADIDLLAARLAARNKRIARGYAV